MARARRMADCFEAAAYDAAEAAGHTTLPGKTGYAITWLALRAADRIVKLEAARVVPETPPAHGAAAPTAQPPSAAAPIDITKWQDKPRASRMREVCMIPGCGCTGYAHD